MFYYTHVAVTVVNNTGEQNMATELIEGRGEV